MKTAEYLAEHPEIERRFLVTRIRGGIETLGRLSHDKIKINQGYFELPDPTRSF